MPIATLSRLRRKPEMADAGAGRISRVEIAVGDAGDRLDDRNMGDRVDEDGKSATVSGRLSGRHNPQAMAPKADLINQENDAEDDGLGRENRTKICRKV